MKRNNDTRRITFSEIGNALAQNLGSVDGERAAALTGLARVRQAKATQLAREQARLTKKYGANDARVQTIAAQRATNAIVVANVEREALRAQTAMPTPDDNAWIVHGHVFGPDRSPQAERGRELFRVAVQEFAGDIAHVQIYAHGIRRGCLCAQI